jgi:hypothetical protein
VKDTKFFIVPIAVDMLNGKYYTIVINDTNNPSGLSLPYIINDFSTEISLQIKECILKYIKVNPEWLKINLYNQIRNKDNNLEIFYYFSIPYDNIKIVDPEESALINFDLLCMDDPFFCHFKYYI